MYLENSQEVGLETLIMRVRSLKHQWTAMKKIIPSQQDP